jgi:hypothetical protein
MSEPLHPDRAYKECDTTHAHGEHAWGVGAVFQCPGIVDEVRSGAEFQPAETINHPAHYGGDTTYEVIKVLEAWEISDFCLGNTIKYVARAGKKGEDTLLQDLKKAAWYLERKIEQEERKK